MSVQGALYRVAVRRGHGGPAEAEHQVSALAYRPTPVPAAAPTAEDGSAVATGDFVTYFRSACKPFQALPLVERGHARRLGLTAGELALLCASHSGSRAHVEIVRGILARLGLDESALRCGFHYPQDAESEAHLRAGRCGHSPVFNNCSGKHAGMLALAVSEGWPIEDYVAVDHPVQRACTAAVAEVCGLEAGSVTVGVDGCSAANAAVPLSAMARGFARLAGAREGADGADERERALALLRTAMQQHPVLVAGEGRLDTDLMRASRGGLVSKGGAEGLQCVGVPAAGAGVALKVHDGAHRALGPATVAFLAERGWLGEDAVESLARWARPVIHNHRGLEVGEVRVEVEPAPSAASARGVG